MIPLRLEFSARAGFRLPRFTGSLWRGALGHGLRRAVCSEPGTECAECPLRTDCIYHLCFGDEVALGKDAAGRYRAPPRPFVMQPPVGERCLLPGDPFFLDLVLLGPAVAQLTSFLEAFRLVAEQGLGRERHRAALEGAAQAGWDADGLRWLPLDRLPAVPPPPPSLPQRVRLSLDTPLRLKYRGDFLRPEGFRLHLFLDNLLQRQALLAEFYATPAPAGNRDSLRLPDDGAILAGCLDWAEWGRWSQRQREKLKIGGIVGDLLLDGAALADCWEALWLGQWLNVGNASAFGLGRYVLGQD